MTNQLADKWQIKKRPYPLLSLIDLKVKSAKQLALENPDNELFKKKYEYIKFKAEIDCIFNASLSELKEWVKLKKWN